VASLVAASKVVDVTCVDSGPWHFDSAPFVEVMKLTLLGELVVIRIRDKPNCHNLLWKLIALNWYSRRWLIRFYFTLTILVHTTVQKNSRVSFTVP
jgi:hypothetical protein